MFQVNVYRRNYWHSSDDGAPWKFLKTLETSQDVRKSIQVSCSGYHHFTDFYNHASSEGKKT